MASTLDLYIDTSTGQLVEGGSVVGGALPTLTRNDSYTLRLRLLEKQTSGLYDDIDLTGATLKAGIGTIEQEPSSGSFKLSINGTTSSAIPFNSTAISVYTAISNNVSTVALYGSDTYGSYLLTATQPNTAMSFGSDAFTLFPTSSVLVSTRRNPATGIEAQQVVRLVRNPIVYADTFTTTPTAGQVALTLLSTGTTAVNETYELTVGQDVKGGSFSLVFGANATTAIPVFQTAVSVQNSISAGISTVTANCSVQDNGNGGYIIAFTGRLGLTNVTTSLTLDASGIQFIPFKQTTLTINTAEVEDAFADSGETTITPTLEIELTQSGTPKTVFQGDVTIRKDLITVGSSVPGAQAGYYTKSEADDLFVEDSSTNVNAAGRALVDSTSVTAFNYETRQLINSLGSQVVSYGAGLAFGNTPLGFYGTTVTAQPASTNVVSALVNLGLVASSVTLGNVVTNSTVNVDATNQRLYSGGQISIDYGTRSLRNSSGTTVAVWNANGVSIGRGDGSGDVALILGDSVSYTSISFGRNYGSKIGTSTLQKFAFYDSTPIVQPSNINAVSGLINLGLLASGTTYGVLPSSPRTLTTLTSVTFGTVAANDQHYRDVVITGALVNDVVLLGLPSAVSAGAVIQGVVYQTNTVCLSCTNSDNSSIDVNTATYRITVIGY